LQQSTASCIPLSIRILPPVIPMLKNGCSMIIDPFGDVITECRQLGDDVVMATLIPQKLIQAGGYRYKNARRPELYGAILSASHEGIQKVAWMKEE
jgi:hypothetical protein